MSERDDESIRYIDEELQKIEVRLEELTLKSQALADDIRELTDKVNFYMIINESWTDEEDE